MQEVSYTRPPGLSTRSSQAAHIPTWIVFRAGGHESRMPFEDVPANGALGWRYVLDITSAGMRADREGDCIVVTGRTCDGFAGGFA